MPKKFQGENSKAAAARARKLDAAKQNEEAQNQAIEDALWAESDKHVQRKQQRKEDKMKKKQETVEKKAQLRALEEEEMSSLKGISKVASNKVTRADIATAQEQQEKGPNKSRLVDLPLEENVNRVEVEGIEARNVDDAIAALSINPQELDRHPERRMKAAYQAFEDANLPRLKAENSNMRLSQLKQLLKKDWMKSPENPLNQRSMMYNAK